MSVLHDVPAHPDAVPTVTPPPPSTRLVPAIVRGQRIAVPCASWCVVDHSRQRLASLEDLYHEGEMLALVAPEFDGLAEVMVTAIRQDPFHKDADGCLPYLGFDAAGEGDPISLQPEAALAFVDQAIAHFERVRAQVQQLAEAREAARQAVAQ